MKVLISAAETSSDAHGAELLRALRDSEKGVEAFGIGGPKLQAAGLRAVVDARELLAMGFFEIFGRLPRIFSALRELERAAASEKPDVAVVIDYPDFHFRLARRLSRLGVPVVYYIPPKVWVWRKKRIRTLKERFVKVLSILPFEREFYEKEGVPVTYVGSPLADQLPLELTRPMARAGLGLHEADLVLALMPGSRPSEISQHLDLMLDAAQQAAARLRSQGKLGESARLVVLMPFPVTSKLEQVKARVDSWVAQASGKAPAFILDVRVSQGDAFECLVAADAGLIKSGTSTLEAAVLGCHHAVVYKPTVVTEWIFKNLIRYSGPVGLSNLVAGWSSDRPLAFNEILCSDATVDALAADAASLLSDPARRRAQAEAIARVRSRLLGEGPPESRLSPSRIAAREVAEVAHRC
jgi:lipid-A-disaccharide synthase